MMFCRKKETLNFKISSFKKIDDCKDLINSLNIPVGHPLSLEFSKAIESSCKENISQIYCFAHTLDNKLLLYTTFTSLQLIDFQRDNSIDVINCRTAFYSHFFKTTQIDLLCCGSPFISDQFPFWANNTMSSIEITEVLNQCFEKIVEKYTEYKGSNFWLIKDFYSTNDYPFDQENFQKVSLDVGMQMSVNCEWHTFEDYLSDLNSKFRTKAKSVLNKSSKLISRNLDYQEIHDRKIEIFSLYKEVLDKSNYQFGAFELDTFPKLKKELGENYQFEAYFYEDQMLAFKTNILVADTQLAHYVGLNYNFNTQFCLYQRILYDFIKDGIENKVDTINFARTAEEIKSGVGAEPVELQLFLKHKNKLFNSALKHILKQLKPSPFEQRKPFKVETLV